MGTLSSLTFNGSYWCQYPGLYHTDERRGIWKEGDAVTMDTTMTEADFSGRKLGVAGAQILAAFMASTFFQDKGLLSSLTFGEGQSDWIKPSKCSGSSFEVGCVVTYKGESRHIVGKYSDGDIKFSIPVTIDTTMTEADFSNAKMGASGAIILAAWLEHKVQHTTHTNCC